MDLFRYFRNNKSLNEMIDEFNGALKSLGFEPYTMDFKTSEESGFDENGKWTKSTFKTDDGNLMVVTIRSNYDFTDEKVKSNDVKFLENELERAIESQDFEMAVKLRDKIKHIKSNEKVLETFEKELKQAIKDQDFEKCIDLRDKIKNIKSK
jgi:excinuclease UvrABC helicase subunit UvrB